MLDDVNYLPTFSKKGSPNVSHNEIKFFIGAHISCYKSTTHSELWACKNERALPPYKAGVQAYMFITIAVCMHSRNGKYFHYIWPLISSQGIKGNFKLKKITNCLNQDEPGAQTSDPFPLKNKMQRF